MLSERQLEALLQIFDARMQEVTDDYISRMGEHLRDIGRLTATNVHRLTELKRLNANVDAVRAQLARAAERSQQDIDQVFLAVAESDYRFASKYYGEARQMPIRRNKAILRILQAQARIAAQEMRNLSRTTLMSEGYRKAVDTAIQTVQSGLTDYSSAIRSAVRRAGQEGLRVRYPNSGLTRRLDTAVRQNVLDGVRSINRDVLLQTGKEFGANGVELSAHSLCAPDHLPWQGRQYSMREFENLQMQLDRQFGQWNCKHTIYPIKLGISAPTCDDAELERMRQQSTMRIEIDGEEKTRYEWTQEQRRLETAIRQQKDVANLAKVSGDNVLRRETQRRINDLTAQYERISDRAGLIEQRERMSVAGARQVKTFGELSDSTRYAHADFATKSLFQNHIDKHLNEYGDISAEDYLQIARSLLRARPSDDILRMVREDGSIAKYRISTNDFVVGSYQGNIRTLFKPTDGLDYWVGELIKHGQN